MFFIFFVFLSEAKNLNDYCDTQEDKKYFYPNGFISDQWLWIIFHSALSFN